MSTITETLFAPLAIATAPEASRPMLEKVKKSIGFIPNLMAIFANNPTVLEGYLALGAVFEKGSFTPHRGWSLGISKEPRPIPGPSNGPKDSEVVYVF